jgi:hypothetical protein
VGTDDEFVAKLLRQLGGFGGLLRVDDELNDPALVAEVDEDEAAEVAPARDPAGEDQGASLVAPAQPASGKIAPGAHQAVRVATRSSNATTRSAPPDRTAASVARAITTMRAPVLPAWVS